VVTSAPYRYTRCKEMPKHIFPKKNYTECDKVPAEGPEACPDLESFIPPSRTGTTTKPGDCPACQEE
jgi:hypothetical protein